MNSFLEDLKNNFWLLVLITVGLIFIALISVSFQHEAETYNRLCKPTIKATASDAFWSELKVDGNCAKK